MTNPSFLRNLSLLALTALIIVGCRSPKLDENADVRHINADGEFIGIGGFGDRNPGEFTEDDWTRGPTTIPEVPGAGGWGPADQAIPGAGGGGDDFQIVTEQRWPPVYFGYNRYSIGETERQKLSRLADWMRSNPRYHCLIEGHCDERGSNEYNRALGERRALTIKDYLIQLGVDANRLRTISYGEERPVDSASNEQAWAKNRRGEFVILLPRG